MSFQLIRPDIDLDFVGKRYFFVVLSTLINVAAIVLLFTVGLNYGVDFVGGSVVQVQFNKPTNAEQIRRSLSELGLGEITVQDFGGTSGHSFLLRFEQKKNIGSMGPLLEQQFTKALGPDDAKVVRVESVGAKVGNDLRTRGFEAVIGATVFMGIFIAIQFRNVSWSFGAGAVIALIHDVFFVMFWLVITQLQFDLTTLAALLTVIGYSVHDTVIVSDRIREDAAKRRREPIEVTMNRAINETLSRTLLTSGTAISVLIALLAFGGPILRSSAFTLLVGFITGTYSSIYIAGPVVLFWEGGKKGSGSVSSRAA
ncbi:MAG TPA: protein translocase subunit SecF [Candidatus Binataceae bacterium]|nr:protein translocase subunit SecF [Candidatus Binataceae bacterium]